MVHRRQHSSITFPGRHWPRHALRTPVPALLLLLIHLPQPHVTGHRLLRTESTPSSVRLGVVGDHGREGPILQAVAQLVKGWRVDAVISLGDTNYPSGSRTTIDANVGKYWHKFMWPYNGTFGQGSPIKNHNRFWPCPGNHDYMGEGGLTPYLDYMPVRGRRFYDVKVGPVHLFSLDSDSSQTRHNFSSPGSLHNLTGLHNVSQAVWLHRRLTSSSAPWKLVTCHHPPFSSGAHGSTQRMQWPFEQWGVTAVLSGHDHSYERVTPVPSGFPYFVNGMGGAAMYGFRTPPEEGSALRLTSVQGGGAQLIEADEETLTLKFFSTLDGGVMLDCYQAKRVPLSVPGAASAAPAGAHRIEYSECRNASMPVPQGADLRTGWQPLTDPDETRPPSPPPPRPRPAPPPRPAPQQDATAVQVGQHDLEDWGNMYIPPR